MTSLVNYGVDSDQNSSDEEKSRKKSPVNQKDVMLLQFETLNAFFKCRPVK